MRRRLALQTLAGVPGLALGSPHPTPADPWALLAQGAAIVLLRHAHAPGIGDPAHFTLGRCETQRNLDDDGRRQARAFGRGFRQRVGLPAAVWSSQWCRCLETAREAFGPTPQEQPAFNSFFAENGRAAAQTAAARALLRQWRGPGVLVVVTHQVNITALTGIVPAPSEAIALHADGAALPRLGRLPPV